MKGTEKKKSKQILEYFEYNPNKDLSPGEVSIALGLEPKLVASVLGRLVAQGLLIKTGRGKYKHLFSAPYDFGNIIKDARTILANSFGKDVLKRMGLKEEYEDLTPFLAVLRQKFGSRLANNLLKQAILKSYKGKEADALINKLGL